MISPSSFLASPCHAVARKSALTWLAVTGALGAAACSDQSAPTAPPAAEPRSLTALDPEASSFDPATLTVSNTWATMSPIPTSLYLTQAGTLSGIIYVVGGTDFNAASRALQAYNVATNTWSARQPLRSTRYEVNGASPLNGRLYVTGGLDNSQAPTKTVYAYDPLTDSWARKADLPVAGGCGAQAVIGGQLYVYVGCTAVLGGHHFWRYNPATNTWVSRKPPPTLHRGPAAGAFGENFYLAGGGNGSGHNLTLDVYNAATNRWVTRAPPPVPLVAAASGVLNKKLYVAGGNNGGILSRTLSVYNPATNTWTTKAPMPTARYWTSGAVATGRFFVIAGLGPGFRHEVEAYAP